MLVKPGTLARALHLPPSPTALVLVVDTNHCSKPFYLIVTEIPLIM